MLEIRDLLGEHTTTYPPRLGCENRGGGMVELFSYSNPVLFLLGDKGLDRLDRNSSDSYGSLFKHD